VGVEDTVIEEVEHDAAVGRVVVHVRPTRASQGRCGVCGSRAGWYDRGEGRRQWRALDLGTMRVFVEADAPRVNCRTHGPTVRAVPWARHGVGHTRVFDQQVAWLATQCSKSAITQLMRIAWRTVGAIITRVWDDTTETFDPFAGLRRIGVDEISYKRNHLYLTIVVDHDTGRLVWASPGRDQATVHRFFDALAESGKAAGEDRLAMITHVSADGAGWIGDVVARRCPAAVRCADPFHVVKWATTALDEVRREAWNDARRAGHTRGNGRGRRDATGPARAIARSRYALWKNPENLTERQQVKLAWIAKTDPRLYRAYLLKEGLRLVFQLPPEEAADALEAWIRWARRSRIASFVALQRSITRHRQSILAAIEHGLSNGLIESVNTKIRLLTRVAFGFRSPEALIALAMLTLGGHQPALPGR
jgi:transposase